MFIKGRNEYSQRSYEYGLSRPRGSSSGEGIGKGVLYVIAVAIVLIAGFTIPQLIPESVAYNTAEGIGFTHVRVVKREWLFIQFTGCDKSDSVKFTVTGTNDIGAQQTFFVCAGLFKGGTPRFR